MDGKSQGLVFDIKRYSIKDGPGIRTTVFFKGCPLRCPWCHNPEGQSFEPEIMIRPSRCLAGCSECIDACPEGAIVKASGVPAVDRALCPACGQCADACPAGAIEVVGRRLSSAELMAEVEKDGIFQEESGGGVTFSGGEPLSQPGFLLELLELCRKKEIHAAVDTCGFAPPDVLESIAEKTGLFLFDLKAIDEEKHAAFTGFPNTLILENLRRLAARGSRVIVRIPVVPGVNDDEKNIRGTAEFLRSLGTISDISLLPYHKLGRDKYKGLEKAAAGGDFAPPPAERLRQIKKDLEACGFRVSLGE
jgi:pyruvate formate lyase activating enzyme